MLLFSFVLIISLDLGRLTQQIIQDSSRLQSLLPIVAGLESSLIQNTRELQSTCLDILASGSVEQVSYLFDPPSVLDSLANIDRDALDKMEQALLQSGYLPGTLPGSIPQAYPSKESTALKAGSSSSIKRAPSTALMESTPTDAIVMGHPPVAVIAMRLSSPEVPETPEADA